MSSSFSATLKLNTQVTSVTEFRKVALLMGWSLNRKDDCTMLVWMEPGKYGLSHQADQDVEKAVAIPVDEGLYSRANNGTENQYTNSVPWMEYVFTDDVLRILVEFLDPEFKPERCDYIGRGRTQAHYQKQYSRRLIEIMDKVPDGIVLD